tara:strand:+ start:2223 stop:3596 length:1374 start_codon:yes stop_codon:yes gene_type:complete
VQYQSTRNNKIKESFTNVLFQGLSKDGGLYMPILWPRISLDKLKNKSYEEIAFLIINPFTDKNLSEERLRKVIDKTYKCFDHDKIAPLVNLEKNKYVLELFYGPTLAFKDYAMQFLGNLFSDLLQHSEKNITVIGATSGDTGSAAINAFKAKKNVKVFILHPHDRVSEVQRRQMTTAQEQNIHNLAIRGTFDDCQKIIKQLFLNKDLQLKTSLTAVNSINWARLIAQVVYYFWAYAQLKKENIDLNFIVPTGNFGNVFSARIAKYMGLPIKNLHVATNENDILFHSINEGKMIIKEVTKTYSPSMDIQISSNFERQLFESSNRNSNTVNEIMNNFYENGNFTLQKNIIEDMQTIYNAHSVTNLQTLETIQYFKKKYNYLSDPHTATGLSVLDKIKNNNINIALGCAHPSKFGAVIKKATGEIIKLPPSLENIFDKSEKMIILENNFHNIKKYILENL